MRAWYTSPLITNMQRNFWSLYRILTVIFLLALPGAAVQGEQQTPPTGAPGPWTVPAIEFVTRILNRAGSPSTVSLALNNRSPLTAAEAKQIRRSIEAQLRNNRVRMVEADRALAEITVTISQNRQGLLWIAEIQQGLTRQLVMLPVENGAAPKADRASALVVRKSLVFSRKEPILDFDQSTPQTLTVLTPDSVSLYAMRDGRWQLRTALPIAQTHFWPRDMRGHIVIHADARIDVYLPGTKCEGSAGDSPRLWCFDSDDPWPLANTEDGAVSAFYASRGNFFTGTLVAPGSRDLTVPPFFSAAMLGGDGNAAWVFAGTDGRARISFSPAAATAPEKAISGWGGDIAAVNSGCGARSQLVVSRPGDETAADGVQAFEIVNEVPVPASAAVELSGPVSAMWRTSEGSGVNAVIQNLTTGDYEATHLTIACGQ